MKRKIYLGIAVVLFATTLLSWNSGTPGGKTGSPIDVNTCTQCHGGTASLQDGWITSNIPAAGYTPGETYTFTATGNHTGAAKFGFEITSEDASSKVGEFIVTDATTTKLDNGSKAITHTSSNTASSGSKTWSFDWTAPATGTGDVTFYGAFNAANGNGETSGDVIYTSELAVTEDVSSKIEKNKNVKISITPNPTSEKIILQSDLTIHEIKMIDFSGKLISNFSNVNSNFKEIRIASLSKGIYFLIIKGEGFQKTEKVIVK